MSAIQQPSRWIIGVFFGFGIAGMAFGGQLTVKRQKAKVYSEPSKSAAVIQEFDKGAEIESLKREGMYWQIQLDGGKTGYIAVMAVKRSKSSKTLNQAIRMAVKEGRKTDDNANARARSSVMGVRGLDETDDAQFAGNARPNLRLVYQMEDRSISSADLEKLETLVHSEIEARMNRAGR